MDPEGKEGLKAHANYSNHFSSFGRFHWVFGPKKAVLGHKMRNFGRAPPDLAPPVRGATSEFLAENLDFARAPTT